MWGLGCTLALLAGCLPCIAGSMVTTFHRLTLHCAVQMVAAPQVIYTSSKSDELFLEKLREGTGPNPEAHKFDVRLEKASAFNADGVSRHHLGLLIQLEPGSGCRVFVGRT